MDPPKNSKILIVFVVHQLLRNDQNTPCPERVNLFETLSKQSPLYLENDEEYETIFENANSTLHAFGYALREEKVMTIILIDSYLLFSIILGQK